MFASCRPQLDYGWCGGPTSPMLHCARRLERRSRRWLCIARFRHHMRRRGGSEPTPRKPRRAAVVSRRTAGPGALWGDALLLTWVSAGLSSTFDARQTKDALARGQRVPEVVLALEGARFACSEVDAAERDLVGFGLFRDRVAGPLLGTTPSAAAAHSALSSQPA